MRPFILIFLLFYSLLACSVEQELTPEEHLADVEEWHQIRVETLKAERGWLKLAGLFWLNEGESTFGSSSDNALIFPDGSIPAQAGTITLDGDLIRLLPAQDVHIDVDGEHLTGAHAFQIEESPEFTHGRLAWTFISRDELTGLRLFDQESPVYKNFSGIDRFPVNQTWQVNATLVPHPEPTTIPIVNILGQTSHVDSPGVLEFLMDGNTYRLTALEAANNRLFLILGDETNRSMTFQGGRYMYVDNPGPNRSVIVDFNKAYNPPCAFSEYTTCQLPPPENRLPISVEAGEKRYAQAVK